MCSYESIKSIVRLLLTSASNGLSLDQLNADYQYYNQLKSIPYENFGYSTLFDFVCDMSDIAQLNLHSSPPVFHAVRPNDPTKRQVSSTVRSNKPLNKNVKRLALNCLSNSNRQSNSSAENLIYQLTNLTMNPKSSENLFQNQILTISINSNNRCQIVRYSNRKYFIPCFELSRILNINENAIDKETMFSRIRIYQSNDLFNIFKNVNNSCQHSMNCHRPYVFLLLISSIIPVLKMSKYMNQYHEIVLAFEQLLMMEIESNKK